jgi:hypothetical protein
MPGWVAASLVLCAVTSCGSAAPAPRVVNADARPIEFNGARLLLELRAISDPAARGLDPPKMLEVTLRNDVESRDVALVNSGLAPSGGGAGGVIQINLRYGSTVLENRCLVNALSPSERGYIYLAPGDAITRVLKLSCYRPPRHERLVAIVTYEDRQPPAQVPREATAADDPLQLPCSGATGLTPDELAVVFRGPLVSNKIEFGLDQP